VSKVILDIQVIYTYVKTDDDNVHSIVDEVLAVKVPWARWSRAYKMGLWDGYKRFYDILRSRFLTGLLQYVVAELVERGVNVEIEGSDKFFWNHQVDLDSIQLNGVDSVRWRETQLPVLKQVLSCKRASVKMGTGSGKTEVIAGILKVLSDKRALVLVHRVELLQQMRDRLMLRLGEEVGVIGAGEVDIDKRVVVGMVQSVWAKKPKLVGWLRDGVDVLLIDECHHCSSMTWANVAMSCGAEWRYGFSGTPLLRNDEKDMLLMGLTGGVIFGVTVDDLVEKGYAAKPKASIIMVPYQYKGKWNKVFEEVYGRDERMMEVLKFILREEVKGRGKRGVVIFVERIRHGARILDELKGEGFNVVFVHGGVSDEERIEVVNRMREKRYDVVIATTIFDEGIDVSGIDGVVFWCSTKSVARVMQRIGRGVRVEEGKREVAVWDFVVDNKYMKEHLRKRLVYYDQEKIERRFLVWTGDGLVEMGV
jgi:superfamily II DNA or RNA helicase